MELSVIEKQRAALRRINHGQQLHHLDMADSDHGQQLRWRSTINQQRNSCSATSAAEADWQWNSVSKKRKAEFDIEEKIQNEAEEEEEAALDENSDITTSGNTKASEAQKQDYIHVRARRGQATDSHSLAERARREKLSKKMKCLQDLVPGCNKVTGKAGMLDEIINYVHSLQKQVEFLSTKLATINPRIDFNIDNFFAKEIPAFEFQYNPMQPGSSNCMTNVGMDQISSRKEGSCCLPIPEVFLDSSCISQLQQLSGWESDWQNQFPAGFQ